MLELFVYTVYSLVYLYLLPCSCRAMGEPPAVGSTGSTDTAASESGEKGDAMESASSSSSEGTRTACDEGTSGCPRGDRGEEEEGGACDCEAAGSQDLVASRSEKEAGLSGSGDEEGGREDSACEKMSNCNSEIQTESADTAVPEPVSERDQGAQGGEASKLNPPNLDSGSKRENVVQEDVDSSSDDVRLKTESSKNDDAGDRFFTRDNSRRSHNPCLMNLLTSALEDRENSTPIGLESPDAVTADEGARERNFKPAELTRGVSSTTCMYDFKLHIQ